jgi:hypothetical protein
VNQSEVLGGALIAGFLIYLAMTKRLGVYWKILTGGTASGGTAASSGGTGTGNVAGGILGGGVTYPSGIAAQGVGSQGTAGTPAVVGQPGSPAFVPTQNTIGNLLSGNWWQPSQSTTQGTLTPYGSSQAGGGIGMM